MIDNTKKVGGIYSRPVPYLPWDYEVKYNGAETPYDKGNTNYSYAGFTLYQYREDLDGILDSNIKGLANSMRADDSQTTTNGAIDGVITLVSVIPGMGEAMASVSGMRIISSVAGGVDEAKETNGKIDEIDKQLNDGNASRAMYYGASVVTYADGTYARTGAYVDKDGLNAAIEVYNNSNTRKDGEYADFNADDIEKALLNGESVYSIDGAKEYIEWYTTGNGERDVKEAERGSQNE